jgi:hypothetical protein
VPAWTSNISPSSITENILVCSSTSELYISFDISSLAEFINKYLYRMFTLFWLLLVFQCEVSLTRSQSIQSKSCHNDSSIGSPCYCIPWCCRVTPSWLCHQLKSHEWMHISLSLYAKQFVSIHYVLFIKLIRISKFPGIVIDIYKVGGNLCDWSQILQQLVNFAVNSDLHIDGLWFCSFKWMYSDWNRYDSFQVFRLCNHIF